MNTAATSVVRTQATIILNVPAATNLDRKAVFMNDKENILEQLGLSIDMILASGAARVTRFVKLEDDSILRVVLEKADAFTTVQGSVGDDKAERLLSVCREFIEEQRISCGEDIYQSDRVIENAYGFIESICEIVGYKESENDDE